MYISPLRLRRRGPTYPVRMDVRLDHDRFASSTSTKGSPYRNGVPMSSLLDGVVVVGFVVVLVLVIESQGRIVNADGVNERRSISSEGNGGSAKREDD